MGSHAGQLLKRIGYAALHSAQGGKCHICGHGLKGDANSLLSAKHVSMDHVWAKCDHKLPAAGHVGNALLAHPKCNSEKSNRRPTGCEIILLFAVNRRMGLPEAQTAKWDQPFTL